MSSSIARNFASVKDDVESFVVKTQPQPRNEPGLLAKRRTITTFAFLPATSPHFFAPHHTQAELGSPTPQACQQTHRR